MITTSQWKETLHLGRYWCDIIVWLINFLSFSFGSIGLQFVSEENSSTTFFSSRLRVEFWNLWSWWVLIAGSMQLICWKGYEGKGWCLLEIHWDATTGSLHYACWLKQLQTKAAFTRSMVKLFPSTKDLCPSDLKITIAPLHTIGLPSSFPKHVLPLNPQRASSVHSKWIHLLGLGKNGKMLTSWCLMLAIGGLKTRSSKSKCQIWLPFSKSTMALSSAPFMCNGVFQV